LNRAEYIIKTINDATEAGIISQRESVRVLVAVGDILNSGLNAEATDSLIAMDRLWKEVHGKWGKRL